VRGATLIREKAIHLRSWR